MEGTEKIKKEVIRGYHEFIAKANMGRQVDYSDLMDHINMIDMIEAEAFNKRFIHHPYYAPQLEEETE
jgi:hypothetical protein